MTNSIQNEISEKIFAFLKNISQSVMKTYSKLDNVNIAENPSTIPVMGHWMSVILVSGPAFKVVFKAHYKTYMVREFVGPIYGKDPNLVTPEQVDDFMREFCNLVAGQIKKLGAHNSMDMGISLPIATRGFDEVFASSPSDKNHRASSWSLKSGEIGIVCSADVDFTDLENLPEAGFNTDIPQAEHGSEVDFL